MRVITSMNKKGVGREELLLSGLGFALSQVVFLDFYSLGPSYLVGLFLFKKKLLLFPLLAVLLGSYFFGTGYDPLFLLMLFFFLQGSLLPGPNLQGKLFFLSIFYFLGLLVWFFLTAPGSLILLQESSKVFFFLFFSLLLFNGLQALYQQLEGRGPFQEKQIPPFFLLLFFPLLALPQFTIQGIQLLEILYITLLFFCSMIGGMGIGAAVGTLFSLSLFLSSFQGTSLLFYPLLGLFCGLLQKQKELGLLIGFLSALFLQSHFLFSFSFPFPGLVEGFGALVLFMFLKRIFPFSITENSTYTERKDKEGRALEYSHHLQKLQHVFLNSPMGTIDGEQVHLYPFLWQQIKGICSSCSHASHCHSEKPYHNQELFSPLLLQRKKEVSSLSFPEHLKDCPHSQKILSFIHGSGKGEEKAQNLQVMKKLLSLHCRGLEEGFHEISSSTHNNQLSFLMGIANWNPEEVSGDSSLIKRLPGGRFLVGISDGLGTGSQAFAKSQAVLELLFHLLSLGMKEDTALQILNLFCYLTYSDEEYSTLDLAIFSSSSPEMTLYKYGAAATFIKRGHQISTICCSSLPLGVTTGENPPIHRKYQQGDEIILVTDGILDVCRRATVKEEWLIQFLKETWDRDPQGLADSILQAAQSQMTPDLWDDMTVIVIQPEVPKTSF